MKITRYASKSEVQLVFYSIQFERQSWFLSLVSESKEIECAFTFSFSIWVRCTINRSHSTPCKKAEFEHLKIFPGHCLDFFLSVSGKICHSAIKIVKRQPTLIISFSQHSPFLGNSKKIRAEIRPASDVTWGVRWGVCDKIVHTKMHFSASD